jgi:hypothetical protein
MNFSHPHHLRDRRLLAIMTAALVAVLIAQPLSADESESNDSHVIEVKLVVRPAGESRPALKYPLLPPLLERHPGDAAIMYTRIAVVLGDTSSPADLEKLVEWNKMSLKELPLEEVEQALLPYQAVLDDLDLAARYEGCTWQVPLRGRDLSQLVLPAIERMPDFASLLALQVRLQISRDDMDGAIRTLQTGFAMGRQTAAGPTLVHCLTGRSVCSKMTERVRELIQHPDSPNLYWSLSSLPRPLIDWRTALENEPEFLYRSFPELRDVKGRSEPAEYWQGLWDELAERVANWEGVYQFYTNLRPGPLGTAANAIGKFPAVKQQLIKDGWTEEDVERMPVPQVLLIHTLKTYDEARDELRKWAYLPHYEDTPIHFSWERGGFFVLLDREVLPLASSLLLNMNSARLSTAWLERDIAMLRTVEALRLYAAANKGEVPVSLNEVTQVPIPVDPLMWQPFDYQRNGKTVTLKAQERIYPEVRFEITFTQ